jgi:signal peptidase I
MEEILLHQRYSYARITPFKNYSKIPREVLPHSGIHKQLSYDDDFGTTTSYYDAEDGIGLTPLLDGTKKKNTRYFYWKDELKDMPVIKYASKHKLDGGRGVFYTTKDRHIKKYYNEPFSDILVIILERSIIKRGDKVTIKTNKYTKHRGFNCKYFKANKFSTSVTFDMVKGDFLLVTSAGKGKDRKKIKPTFRKNSFNHLLNFIKSPDGPFRFLRNHMGKNNGLYKDLHYIFDDKQFNQALYSVFNCMITYPTDGALFRDLFYDEVMRWFINTKKIKTPNEYKDLILRYYPTEKYLKKNDRKLIASILDVFQIKSKITIKLLHERPNIDLKSLIRLCYLFGDQYQKYVGSIGFNMFGVMSTINDLPSSSLRMMESTCSDCKNHGYDINDIEKENLLKVLTSEPKNGSIINEGFTGLIVDHFRMLNRIREYDPNIRMKANNITKFHSEHNELSKIISAIKKGWVIQYFYPEETIRQIQQPIKVFKSIKIGHSLMGTDMDDYISITPYVLTREEEYIEEGKFMHHCVASYAETDTSMIISLRTEDEQDRVTCEFQISSGKLIQAKHFSNAQPPKQFEFVIEEVTDIVRIHARFGTLNWLKKERVPIKINGIEIASEKREPRRLIDILNLDDAEPLPF